MILLLLKLAGGLIYLLMGADLLVRGAVGLARRTKVPQALVALTVVAVGTSLPELLVAVQAVLSRHPGILLGNVVGSNVANSLLVVGVAALARPLARSRASTRRDATAMMAATVVLVALLATGWMTRWGGVLLLSGLAAVLIPMARQALGSFQDADRRTPIEWTLGLPASAWLIALFLAVGVGFLPLGARFVVDAAVGISQALGVSERVVGITLVALSTSLPEVATAVVAASRGRSDMVVGTAVGSNLFNILLIMGVAGVASSRPILASRSLLVLDLPAMFLASALLAWFVWGRRRVGRVMGGAMTLAYLAYVGVVVGAAPR